MKRACIGFTAPLSALLMMLCAPAVLSQRTVPEGTSRLATATGIIKLEYLTPGAPAQQVTISIALPDRTYVTTAWVRADGVARFFMPLGKHTATFRAEKWLSRRTVITTNGRTASCSVFLLAGDANNDNYIDWNDMDILAGAYGSHTGEPGWDSRADFDCDGDVDDFDEDILNSNLYRHGD